MPIDNKVKTQYIVVKGKAGQAKDFDRGGSSVQPVEYIETPPPTAHKKLEYRSIPDEYFAINANGK